MTDPLRELRSAAAALELATARIDSQERMIGALERANADLRRMVEVQERAYGAARAIDPGEIARADPALDRRLDELDALLDGLARAAQGNPYHDEKGQFTGPGGGHGHGHGEHRPKRPRRKGRKPKAARKPHGHGEAGPGARREKASPTRGAMVGARREGKGKDARIVLSDGRPAPDHIRPSMVPPQWTDVRVGTDPKAELLVTARDAKGRPKMVTSESYDARSAALKFNRVSEMIGEHDAIGRQIQSARKGAAKEEADAAWLMQVQATRPGSNADTKARVKAYGATTLEGRHVVQSKDGVRLQFIGKEGVSHDHLVRDPELAKMLVARKKAAGSPDGKLFATTDDKVRVFTAGLGGGKYSPKDFRTSAATRMARDAVKADPAPSRDAKEHAIRVKAVAERVSRLLGNRPEQALKSYIHPAVFEEWEPR